MGFTNIFLVARLHSMLLVHIANRVHLGGKPLTVQLLHKLALALMILIGTALNVFACTLPAMQTNLRPAPLDRATEVTTSFIVADFLGVDDVNQKLDIDLIGVFSWQDDRLSGLEGCRFNVADIWFPPMVLFNSSQLREARTNARNQVEVGENGLVTYKQRYTGLISSYHNLKNFPFDRHTFEIHLGALDLNYDNLQFIADTENTWINERLNIEGWDVTGIKLLSSKSFTREIGQDISLLSLEIRAKRNPEYFAFRVMLLLVFVVAMSWAIFWIPPSRFEFQIGLGATSMLTIIAFNLSIASNLPQLGYMTIMDKILVWAIFLVFMSICEALLAGLLVLNKREGLAIKIDKFSRVLFPSLLVIVWTGLIMSAN